jgi:hypothetical protein
VVGGALTRSSPVNNVELKVPAEPMGAAESRSTPHYWALNINRIMWSSTLFDYLPAPGGVGELWHQRKALLAQTFPEHDWRQVPSPEALYSVPGHDPAALAPPELYRQLRQLNARWGCRFYEGLVAKRITDAYRATAFSRRSVCRLG